jgi:MoaA/NifB/PqqE/SkfB family radical SAM enzyme
MNGISVDVNEDDYGPQRLSIELTNICNLHCSYCLRDEEALYHKPANFLSLDFLRRVVREAREVLGIERVIFTGGEPTLHPQFAEVLELVAEEGLESSFVTNGWHFERIWPAVLANRDSLTHIAFSIDGITAVAHDRWRGQGSFERLIRAFCRCQQSRLPCGIKVAIRQDTCGILEQIAIFAARMGAGALSFVHTMPNSQATADAVSLNSEERRLAEQEIAILSRIFKMKVGLDVGYSNIDVQAPCSPLAGRSCNIDYLGRLTLCCNLSGFRDADGHSDVVADLNKDSFSEAYKKLRAVADGQLQRRREALNAITDGQPPDLFTCSPCLFCLQCFGKVPWHRNEVTANERSLPIMTVSA